MIRKFISIKSVGRFQDCRAHGDVELKRNTLIFGANGVGKTTICSILRSLEINDPSYIIGRKTIDSGQQPTVELLVNGGLRRFDGVSWSESYPHLKIFDSEFVSQNVHSGEIVEINHRRNLYRVIIGEAGIQLARQEADLARQSRAKTSEITTVANEIRASVPQGMGLEEFMGLPADPAIDAKIATQKRTVLAYGQAQQIVQRAPLSEILLPRLPEGFRELLSRTIDDIAEDAEAYLTEHLAAHRMGTAGGNWIAEGLKHAKGSSCPFCGQDIRDLPLIGAFRTVFSRDYKAFRDDIRAMRGEIEARFGEREIGRLTTLAEQNRGAAEFWGRYCNLGSTPLDIPDEIPEVIRRLHHAASALLELKARSPLEPVQCSQADFGSAFAAFQRAESKAQVLASAVTSANEAIAAVHQDQIVLSQTVLSASSCISPLVSVCSGSIGPLRSYCHLSTRS